jgi:hypothetical protein
LLGKMSGDPAIPIGDLRYKVRLLPSWKHDGADFGCISVQSNGKIAHVEIKGYCKSESF